MALLQKITPCLWFDGQAEEAAKFYVSIFKNSGIGKVTYFGKEGFEIHGRPEGSVLVVTFRLEGQEFSALNGGPLFKFNEAISLIVQCEDQAEVDYFWEKLGQGGEEKEKQCGWVKGPSGLSRPVVPSALFDMLCDGDAVRSDRVMKALLQMKKLDLAALRRAYEGKPST